MRWCAIALAAVLMTSTSRAEDGGDVVAPSREELGEHRVASYPLLVLENAVLLAGSTGWYWANAPEQKPDWVMGWDMESWTSKLTSLDTVRFDTNLFWTNSFGHTVQSVLAYQINRGTGTGFAGAVVANLAHAVVWEYVVEYREYPSINDLVVNLVAGPALGEPLWRFGNYFRTGPKTLLNEAMAAVFSPFDGIDHRLHRRAWRNQWRPWHRFRVWTGTSATELDSVHRVDIKLGADLEVVSRGRARTQGWAWTAPGAWSRIAADTRLGTSGNHGGRIHSRTSLGGYETRSVDDEGRGLSVFVGLGTGLTYESSKLSGGERDQLAAYHLVGPQLDVHVRTRDLELGYQLAVYADFGLVDTFAMGTLPVLDPEPPWDSALVARGYYFGLGASVWNRLFVDWGRLHADLETHAHHLWSIDSRQQDRGEIASPEDLADMRAYARLALGVSLEPSWLVVETVVDLAYRRGTVGALERHDLERRLGAQLTVRF